ncbi:hypothetical protein N9B72_01430 [Bacteriovoracaceae bacterium]|nr:hypothetical protein [Bacteriovoracaceae bacterium]
MQQLKVTSVHESVSKKLDLELETVVAISYSQKVFNQVNLIKSVTKYKKIKIQFSKNIKEQISLKLPNEIILTNYIENTFQISKLKILKFYKEITGQNIMITDQYMHDKRPEQIKEFEIKNIFVDSNTKTEDIVEYLFYKHHVIPTKGKYPLTDSKLSFFGESFDSIELAKNKIKTTLLKKIENNLEARLYKAQEQANGKKIGVIYLVNSSKKIQGAMIFDSLSGNFQELILN